MKKIMEESDILDVLIIGGGPIGLACGIEAKKNNLNYIIIEKGCLVNSLYNYPVTMTFFSTSERLEIGGVPFISHGDKPNRGEALEYYRRVQSSWDLNVNLYEKVLSVEKEEDYYSVKTSKGNYKAQNIIVATGFYDIPNLIGVKGEELPKVKHYYDDPHLYAKQKVVVIGASNSAVDVALETYRKGAEVTMIIRDKEIGPRVKYWIRPDIMNRLKFGEIKAYFNSELTEISEQEVSFKTPEGELTIANDWVLAMTGYLPNFDFLEKLGIKLANDETKLPFYDVNTNETNMEKIYLAGVVCGGTITSKWFIENSREHAELIIKNIANTKVSSNYSNEKAG